MKNKFFIFLLAIAAVCLTACPPASNTNNANAENTNTEASPAESLSKVLVDREHEAQEAWKAKNGKFFEDFVTSGFVGVGRFGRNGKDGVPKFITDNPCEIKGYSSSDQEVVELGDGVGLVTMKTAEDVDCGGKAAPSPVWSATVYVKEGDTWKAAYHQGVAAPDAKGEYPAAPEGVKDDPPADADKELTSTLTDLIKKGWDAWSKSDAKWFEDNTADNYVAITGAQGRAGRAERIKYQGEHKCDVKSINIEDARSAKLSDNVALLTYKSVVDGTCDGTKVPAPIWSTSIFVKDGDAWKAASYMGTAGAK